MVAEDTFEEKSSPKMLEFFLHSNVDKKGRYYVFSVFMYVHVNV